MHNLTKVSKYRLLYACNMRVGCVVVGSLVVKKKIEKGRYSSLKKHLTLFPTSSLVPAHFTTSSPNKTNQMITYKYINNITI